MGPCKKCQSDKKFAQNTPNPLLKLESLFLAVTHQNGRPIKESNVIILSWGIFEFSIWTPRQLVEHLYTVQPVTWQEEVSLSGSVYFLFGEGISCCTVTSIELPVMNYRDT